MIGISTVTSNIAGAVLFNLLPESDLESYSRRVSRTKTLDGGCVIVDSGYSASDRTIKAVARYDETKYGIIKTIMQNNALVNVATRDGFYSGAIDSLYVSGHEINFSVLVKERLDS